MGEAALNRQLNEIWSRRIANLVTAGAVLMVLTAVFHRLFAYLSNSSHDWALRSLIFGFSLIFGAAGLCKVHQQASAFAGHAKNYGHMGQALQLARTRLDAALAASHCEQAAALIQAMASRRWPKTQTGCCCTATGPCRRRASGESHPNSKSRCCFNVMPAGSAI